MVSNRRCGFGVIIVFSRLVARSRRPPFVFGEPALHSWEGVGPVFAEPGLAEGVVEEVERFDQVAEIVGDAS